jgi:tetrathionate reductase subunit B
VACKSENGVRLGGFRSWVSEKEVGKYPNVTRHFLPRLCNHCQNPPCARVCPTGATHRRDDGIVEIDKTKCIGCRHCMGACPYNARFFNPTHDPEGERMFPSLTRGTVDKCDFCLHRMENGIVPSCVNTCPAQARTFGDLTDAGSDVSRLLPAGGATTLLPEYGTKPSVFYIGGNPGAFKGS